MRGFYINSIIAMLGGYISKQLRLDLTNMGTNSLKELYNLLRLKQG